MKEFITIVLAATVLAGCSQQGPGPAVETGSRTASQDSTFSRPPTPAARPAEPLPPNPSQAPSRDTQLSFLKSIRDADPQYQTIERALMNENNELGVILSRGVSMDDIPTLMKSLLKQMATQFPGEDLTVIAYAPANPPLKIGTARLDARTREMTFTRTAP